MAIQTNISGKQQREIAPDSLFNFPDIDRSRSVKYEGIRDTCLIAPINKHR